jgi:hypothetical protein
MALLQLKAREEHMEIRIKSASGAVLLLSGLPAFAQESTAKVSAPTSCASCPPPPPPAVVVIPPDPTWFVAGFVVGAALGFLAAKVFGAKR